MHVYDAHLILSLLFAFQNKPMMAAAAAAVEQQHCQRNKIRIVNALWQTQILFSTTTQDYFTWLLQQIGGNNSLLLCKHSSETQQFRARPCMLQWKWSCQHVSRRITILFFPNRTVQFLGTITDNDVYHLYCHCCRLFKQRLPYPRVKTMTIVYPLLKRINNLHRLFNRSHAQCIYETDLFPGVQLTYWSPLHVIIFHTGNVTISGVKSFCQVDSIIHDLMTNKYFPLFNK